MIDYDDLIDKTKETIDKIYKYFNLPKFKHRFLKIKTIFF
jgi:hypothetical protein